MGEAVDGVENLAAERPARTDGGGLYSCRKGLWCRRTVLAAVSAGFVGRNLWVTIRFVC